MISCFIIRRRFRFACLIPLWAGIVCCLSFACPNLSVVVANAQTSPDNLIEVYKAKLRTYLDKDGKASDIFVFTKEGIEIYQPETDSAARKLHFFLSWEQTKSFLPGKPARILLGGLPESVPKPLLNYFIALDPGHIAGSLETAKMERKWVEMKANPARGIKENITLIEGELNLATTKILKKMLEDQGATVMLTRDKPGISAFGITYEKWKDSLFIKSLNAAYERGDVTFEEKSFLLGKANNTEIFRRFFLQEEMRDRARKINEFRPDLTLIIHYNVDETNVNWNKPTKKNFNMAFVPGSFTEDELEKPEARMEFLRLLLTDDLENSIEFSKRIMESLVKKTGVPAALDSCAIYLRGNCLNTGAEGVFCRNLALTRMVKGTLCYGESLYQDNINECVALSKKEITIDDMKTSKRVQQVAEAYFEGILNYIESRKEK